MTADTLAPLLLALPPTPYINRDDQSLPTPGRGEALLRALPHHRRAHTASVRRAAHGRQTDCPRTRRARP